MSDVPDEATRLRVAICDLSIEIDARLTGPEDIEALMARLRHAADFLWPMIAGAWKPRARAVAESDCGANEPPEAVKTMRAQFTVEEFGELVAAWLNDSEFAALSPRQAEALALRRAGYTLERSAAAMGLASSTGVANLIRKAKQRGVAV